jgi:hypothetical protein
VNVLAYADESGTHADSEAVTVAAFLAPAASWGALAYEWMTALDEWGLDQFHMSGFENRRPDFDWPDAVRRARLSRLLAIIQRHVTGSVGVSFLRADFDEAFPPDEIPEPPRVEEIAPGILAPWASRPGDMKPAEVDYRPGELRRKVGGAYGLAASALLIDAGLIAKALPDEPFIDYVFEDGAKGRGQLSKLIDGVLEDEGTRRDRRVASYTFGLKSVPGLQAADLLAYELRKQLYRERGLDPRPTRYPLRVLANLPRRWGYLSVDELRTWHWVLGIGLHHGEGRWNRH